MRLLSYIHFFAFVSYLYLAAYLLLHNSRAPINRACSLFLCCLALWSLQFVIIIPSDTPLDTVKLWMNIGSFGWIGMCYTFLWFSLIYTGRNTVAAARWYHVLSLAWVAILVYMQWQGRIVAVFFPSPFGWAYGYGDSFWVPAYLVYLTLTFGLSLWLMLRLSATRVRRVERWHGLRLFAFTLVSVMLAWILNILLPLLNVLAVPQIGNVTALIWAAWLTTVIVRYKTLTITPVTAADNILTAMSDMLILSDPDGIIVKVNQAACDRIGASQTAIEGLPVTRFLETEKKPATLSLDEIRKKRLENHRMQLCALNGEILPIMLSSSPFMDKFGDLAGTIILARDITDTLESAKALRRSEQRYRELVENINDVIYTVDTDGRITYLSPRIQELSAYEPDELIGRAMTGIVHPDDLEQVSGHSRNALAGKPAAADGRLVKKDGTVVWVHASGRPILENGQVVGIQGILTDIDKLVRTQKEKHELEIMLQKAQKMEAIGTLAGGVAHDLNNILSGIVSYPDFLLMDLPDKSPLREPLEVIKSSGLKASTIIHDMLTLARRGVINLEVLDLNEIVTDFMTSPEHRKQRVYFPEADIEFDLAAGLPLIEGSRVHLAKTLMNLISNALEALPAGEGRVCVRTANRKPEPQVEGFGASGTCDYVMLEVADNGSGIEGEDLDRIFEPFYTKKVMGRSGTGLGMAVVWGTVKDHKGHIEVKSELGQGTVISIYLPATDQARRTPSAPVALSALKGKLETILVVDDVREQRVIASSMLERLNYRVLVADSGPRALDVVRSEPVDLLLIDMIMDPGWDGLETYERILKVRPGLSAIIASGYSRTGRVQRALALGGGVYLKKPYTLEGIGTAVRRVLESIPP